MTHLFMFQIGPVQSFIAQARRTQDLFVGSRILSELALAGVWAAKQSASFEPVFPFISDDYVPRSVPHKFAFLSDDAPEEVACSVRQAVDKRWIEGFANRVKVYLSNTLKLGDGEWVGVFQRQIRSWLEFSWIAVPYDPGKHSESFKAAGRAMAQRKYARPFVQVDEPGVKCTLTGAQTALPLDWEALSKHLREIVVRPNERLGAIATIKRFAQDAGCFEDDAVVRFPSAIGVATNDPNNNEEDDDENGGREVEGYLAILHMDGDQMGNALGTLKTLEQHQEFSRVLAEFADRQVEPIISDICWREDGSPGAGVLVYAGGDDVLALLPLSKAIHCAQELRKAFENTAQKALPGGRMTMSAGLSIVPHKLPFDMGLEMARKAEDTAKDRYRVIDKARPENSQGAIYVVESHGSGQRESGGCWDEIGFVDEFQRRFAAKELSSKYGYDILELHQRLGGGNANSGFDVQVVKVSEAKRIIRRRASEKLDEHGKEQLVQIADQMASFAQTVNTRAAVGADDGWERAANWVILARFLASAGKRGE